VGGARKERGGGPLAAATGCPPRQGAIEGLGDEPEKKGEADSGRDRRGRLTYDRPRGLEGGLSEDRRGTQRGGVGVVFGSKIDEEAKGQHGTRGPKQSRGMGLAHRKRREESTKPLKKLPWGAREVTLETGREKRGKPWQPRRGASQQGGPPTYRE